MRVGLLLISLLICLAIMLMLFKTYTAPSLEVSHKTEEAAQQISGHDANGLPAYKSYQAQPYARGTQFSGIQIISLVDGGAYQTYYGLKPGDVVLQIQGTNVDVFGDYDSAKGQLDMAYQSAEPLTVLRDGAQITLPIGGGKSELDKLLGH